MVKSIKKVIFKYFVRMSISLFYFIGISNTYAQSNMSSIPLASDVTVTELRPGIWLHTTYYDLPSFKHYPANGLIIIDRDSAVMIDTGWTNEQTSILFDWVSTYLKTNIQTVVVTHFHVDRAGGLAEVHRRGAISISLDKTIALLKKENKPFPMKSFTQNTTFHCGNTEINVVYPGPAHTVDNTIVWLPDKKILFAGCIVKSMNNINLGNILDGDLKNYPKTLNRIYKEYSNAEIVIPGHEKWGGLKLIKHTIDLCSTQIKYYSR